MTDRELNRLFERFRTRGDVASLGRVFDLAVPELVRVAASWVASGKMSADDVEDLVQDTFLTAIERARHYDAGRRLIPWLVGILVMHAHERRRDQGRQLDPERLPPRDVDAPEERASAAELAGAIEAALGSATERERGVLDLFLKEGKSPTAIARERGERPGTVRMAIHRGLERLRRALPAGAAFGTAITLTGRRGWADVRSAVLARGKQLALEPTVAVGFSLNGLVGGLLVNKLLLVSVALAVVLGLSWIALQEGAVGAVESMAERAPAIASPATVLSPVRDDVRANPVVADDADQGATREAVARSADPSRAPETFLAGLTGRVVEATGEPVANLELSLIEAGSGAFLAAARDVILGAQSPPGFEIASTRTDDEGRFRLDRADPGAFHLLALDPGGPRADLRTLPVAFEPAQERDVGDIVLAETGLLRGKITGPRGEPIEGARVRVLAQFQQAAKLGLGELRADSRIVARMTRRAEDVAVLSVPAWAAALEHRLPVPTVRTGADGGFELRLGAGRELVNLVVDHPGFVSLSFRSQLPSASSREGGDLTLEPLALSRGRSVTGRVVDASGTPLAGIPVFVGASSEPEMSIVQPVGESDEDGHFRADVVPTWGSVVAVAQRSEGMSWAVATEKGAADLRLVLPTLATLEVQVTSTTGAPVTGAELHLDPRGPIAKSLVSRFFPTPVASSSFEAPLPGVYRASSISVGTYVVSALADGFALGTSAVEIDGDRAHVELVLEPARDVTVTVLDAETRRPVAGAGISLQEDQQLTRVDALGRTGADGRALLERVPAGHVRSLRVDHPGYATHLGQLEVGERELCVLLGAGGSVQARLNVDGYASEKPWVLSLQFTGERVFPESEMPQDAASDPDGLVRIDRLLPGTYAYSVAPDPPSGMSLWNPDRRGAAHPGGTVEILAGETAVLVVEIGARDVASDTDGATISGTITVDGGPEAELVVIAWMETESGMEQFQATTDGGGAFWLEGLPSGAAEMLVARISHRDGTERWEQIGSHRVDVTHGESVYLDLAFETRTQEVQIVSGGRPVEGARVTMFSASAGGLASQATSDASGLVSLMAAGGGRHILQAEHSELGMGRAEVDLADSGHLAPVVIEIDRGVPCAGRVAFGEEGSVELANQVNTLMVHGMDGGRSTSVPIVLENGSASFEIVGLSPGTYIARVFGPLGTNSTAVRFELPPGGETDLDLTFEVDRDSEVIIAAPAESQ